MRYTRTTWLAVAVMALVTPYVLAEDAHRTISVSGQGKAMAPPDMATIQTGVVTQSSTASTALAANNLAMERILNVLKEHRIDSKDVQTSRFHVRPEYRRDRRGAAEPEVIGYRVTSQLSVRVRNLPDLGKVLDALVQAGSNQMSGISFGIDDAAGVLDQARNRAMADARRRARLYALAAGVRVGKVLTIREQSFAVPRPQTFARGMMAEAASTVPIATGEQEIQATIHVVYALEEAQ